MYGTQVIDSPDCLSERIVASYVEHACAAEPRTDCQPVFVRAHRDAGDEGVTHYVQGVRGRVRRGCGQVPNHRLPVARSGGNPSSIRTDGNSECTFLQCG